MRLLLKGSSIQSLKNLIKRSMEHSTMYLIELLFGLLLLAYGFIIGIFTKKINKLELRIDRIDLTYVEIQVSLARIETTLKIRAENKKKE